jgi:DNA-binding NarL/FixJ family response regulator
MASAPATPPGRPIRILLADDHPVLREGLASLLAREADMEVVGQAGDGQEALALALQLVPDVILMDINMPRMDGIKATRLIYQEHPDIRIIGLSLFEETESARIMRHAGAVDYLSKSGTAANIIAAIRTSMHKLETINRGELIP